MTESKNRRSGMNDSPQMKYKAGDQVKIIDCLHGHGFEIGEECTITTVTPDDYHATNGKKHWYVTDDEIELIKS